jgi:hypothetical protein
VACRSIWQVLGIGPTGAGQTAVEKVLVVVVNACNEGRAQARSILSRHP